MMGESVRFGLSMLMYRTESGALRSREIEKMSSFLKRGGLLIADCFDGYFIIPHPDLFGELKPILEKVGCLSVLTGASLSAVRQATELTLAEERVLEFLSPGALILSRDENLGFTILPVTIPDSFDLRDICSVYGGTMQMFFLPNSEEIQVEAHIRKMEMGQCGICQLGFIESPLYDMETEKHSATFARIEGPGKVECIVEGKISRETIKEASESISQWEIGEWE